MNEENERAEIEKAKHVLDRTSWSLQMVGLWPMIVTTKSQIRLTIFMTYFCTHLCMEYADFISLFGNVQMMVINLMESGLQSVIMSKILVLRFSKLIRSVITALEDEWEIDNSDDPEEIKLFLKYNASAEILNKYMMWFATASVIPWYFLPLQNYIIATLQNQTSTLEIPYRIYTFFDISPMDRTIVVYIYEFPMMYTSVCYAAVFGVMTTLIKNVCAQLAILAHRIKNISADRNANSQIVFKQYVEKHARIIELTKNLDNAFQLAMFFELIISTVLIGLVFYSLMLNFSDAEAMAIVTFSLYAIAMLLLIYANCLMGEDLKVEGAKLCEAIYQCEWYDMPPSYKKGLIICMARAQIPLELTAGKFYVYSLQNFTQIVKSSMSYVAMLRTMVVQ